MLLWPSVVILWHSSSECPRFIIKSLIVYTVLVFLLTDVCCNVCRSGMVLCPARWMKYGFHFAFIFFFAPLLWKRLLRKALFFSKSYSSMQNHSVGKVCKMLNPCLECSTDK